MTNEQIDKLHELEDQLYNAKQEKRWLEEWGKELYRPDSSPEVPDKFRVTISRNDFKIVLQREISREDVEAEYLVVLREVDERIEQIEKKIAAL